MERQEYILALGMNKELAQDPGVKFQVRSEIASLKFVTIVALPDELTGYIARQLIKHYNYNNVVEAYLVSSAYATSEIDKKLSLVKRKLDNKFKNFVGNLEYLLISFDKYIFDKGKFETALDHLDYRLSKN